MTFHNIYQRISLFFLAIAFSSATFAIAETNPVAVDSAGVISEKSILLSNLTFEMALKSLSSTTQITTLQTPPANPYDAGYMRPGDLMYSPIQVNGRGGTQLQRAVELFEQLSDFPPDAPLLILTDGFTAVFHVKRTHAFVLPKE
jgi:predicted metal-dependent peptidase